MYQPLIDGTLNITQVQNIPYFHIDMNMMKDFLNKFSYFSHMCEVMDIILFDSLFLRYEN